MRAIIQRVSQAEVKVENQVVGAIGPGLMILLGVASGDTSADASALAAKIAKLRIFSDADGKFNHSLLDIGGEALVVSQFTLFADTRKGRRPSFTSAARPDTAVPLLADFISALRQEGVQRVEQGIFAANMDVSLVNQGPVTIWLDTAEVSSPT